MGWNELGMGLSSLGRAGLSFLRKALDEEEDLG